MTEPHHRHGIAHDVDEIRADLEFERHELDASIKHDYSTSDTGIVPLDRRRPMWHFMGLWTTFVAGFSYMVLGIEIHAAGPTPQAPLPLPPIPPRTHPPHPLPGH